ncbi:MAG: RNA polymerase factor sigma-54, partial [Bdellovibrionales bacterium]|nr:RNA polymerase factor sigma-54 [Bdellovibrionales bacterium]
MALETKLVQKMGQSLLMTPQLQQAIKLLQLNRLEYIEAIQQELLENPVLEENQEEELGTNSELNELRSDDENLQSKQTSSDLTSSQNNDDSPTDWEQMLESFNDYQGASTPKGTFDFEDRPSLEATLTKEETLEEFLVDQLRLCDFDDSDKVIAFHIIGNLDKNAYLCTSCEEIAESCGESVQKVESILLEIQSFDPPGVAARNIQECLIIQLEALGKGDSLEATIVKKHLDKLEKRKYQQIAKAESTDVDAVYKAVTNIQALEPRPGRQYADLETRYITPDIYVHKVGNEYIVQLNEEDMPRLRVSPYYLDILKDKKNSSSEEKAYLTDRLKAASWLIKSIHQRQQTIFKVTESIVKAQKEFLDSGVEKLKPMVLKDVAEDIGMHESTVSRVTSNKYVHTPQGVFELKFFFSSGISSLNGEVSSTGVKEKIKNIISEEPPTSPVSDQQIVETLAAQGINIARRTV